MSVINRMLSDLHQRGESLAPDAASAPANPVMSYATSRLSAPRPHPHSQVARAWVMLGTAAAVAASLPLVWAATRPMKLDAAAAGASAVAIAVVPQASVQATALTETAPTAVRSDRVELASLSPFSSLTFMRAVAAPNVNAQPALKLSATTAAAPPVSTVLHAIAATAATGATPTTPATAEVLARAVPPTQLPLTIAVNASSTVAAAAATVIAKPEVQIERRPAAARDDLARAGDAMALGRTSEAVALLRKVIQAEPANERAHLALLSLLAERGRDDTWRAALLDSAAALPQRFGVAAAQSLNEAGRLEESLGVLQKLPEAARDMRFFSAQGATLQQLNQHAAAVTAFEAAMQLAPSNAAQLPSLLVAQAVSMQAVGKRAQAQQNFERVQQMADVASELREFAAREIKSK